jgi:AraC family transcriptional regulator, melibiose operon regulatory protein
MEREAEARREPYLPIARLKVTELIFLLDRARDTDAAAPPSEGSKAPARFRAEELMRYIDERYSDQLTLGDLAQRFGLNPSYLSRAFHKETGFTIVEQVNKIRIQKSCVLLKRSRSSILDIAFAVGYNSLSHFNKHFRRTMGMSPREFRNRGKR